MLMTSAVVPEEQTLLIVDDMPENLAVLGELLRGVGYRVKAANSGQAALRYASQVPHPDLILLDVMMPEMDGYQVIARLRDDPVSRDTPVVFLTALGDARDEERGLELGAADYITKPIKPAVVLARVHTQLEARQARKWLQDQNAFLESEVARRMADNERMQIVSIRALAHLAEIRDPETGYHLHRTQNYVRVLAMDLRTHPRFSEFLSDANIDLLVKSAPLHDIGKVGIPDHILLKPSKLTAEEWGVMQTHAKLGSDAIERAEADADKPLAFLAFAKEIAHWHHEKWDGSGYPDGLAGDDIPIPARLMALADVFDALICRRVYKAPISLETARQIIGEGRGSHFDPDIADAFQRNFEQFKSIARRHQDDA
jgi:putative two-component system response regulator